MLVLVRKFSTAVKYARKHGIREFFARLKYGPKVNIFDKLRYLLIEDYPKSPNTNLAPPQSVNWFISGFSATSGGHINIMRFLRALETRGYDCRVVITSGEWMGDPLKVYNTMVKAFGPMRAKVFLGVTSAPPAFACVATGHETAYEVRAFTSTCKKFYFVQDYEPWFYAPGSSQIDAEDTYRFGFIGITAGRWLAEKLALEYGMETHPFGFSYDSTLYQSAPRVPHVGKRVFFYARPETERRGFELGIMALRELCQRHQDVVIVLAGGNLSRYDFDFPHEVHGKVSVNALGALYRTCDAALVLSMTNASLLPVELMACGTPVVSNTGAWVEWLQSPLNSKLAPANVFELAKAIEELLYTPAKWQELHASGIEFATKTSWETAADCVAEALAKHGCRKFDPVLGNLTT